MDREQALWTAATIVCAGDIVTTWYGISVLGIAESNPFVAALIAQIGLLPALVASKVGVMAFGLGCYHIVDEYELIMPAIVIVMYTVVTVINTVAIYLYV